MYLAKYPHVVLQSKNSNFAKVQRPQLETRSTARAPDLIPLLTGCR